MLSCAPTGVHARERESLSSGRTCWKPESTSHARCQLQPGSHVRPDSLSPQGDWLCPDCETGKPVQARGSSTARAKVLAQQGLGLARIEALWRLGPRVEDSEATLRWYCVPEETHLGRQVRGHLPWGGPGFRFGVQTRDCLSPTPAHNTVLVHAHSHSHSHSFLLFPLRRPTTPHGRCF